jgi:hypothetical protein
MPDDIEEIAKLLGANIVGEVPDVGGGAFAAAHLGKLYQNRMEEIRNQSGNIAKKNLELPVNEGMIRALDCLAGLLSTPDKIITSAQLAAGLLKGAAIQILNELITQMEANQEPSEKRLEKLKAAMHEWEAVIQELDGIIPSRQAAG